MMVFFFVCLGDLWLIINWFVVNINCLIYFGVFLLLVEDIDVEDIDFFWVDIFDGFDSGLIVFFCCIWDIWGLVNFCMIFCL